MVEAGLRAVPKTVLCESAQWVTGNTTELTSQWTAPTEEYSVAPLPEDVLQSFLPHTTNQKQIWGCLLQQLGSRPCPQQGCDTEETLLNIHCRLWSPQQSHPLSMGNSQHTLRKDVAVIHTKDSPYSKNIRLTEATPGHSHIKTALQDHS